MNFARTEITSHFQSAHAPLKINNTMSVWYKSFFTKKGRWCKNIKNEITKKQQDEYAIKPKDQRS